MPINSPFKLLENNSSVKLIDRVGPSIDFSSKVSPQNTSKKQFPKSRLKNYPSHLETGGKRSPRNSQLSVYSKKIGPDEEVPRTNSSPEPSGEPT